ncbi:diguanylate cyclase (GGDEF)-like protein [Solibacillus kalamii]|uniref:GGDEF domain-containing protein n=1 Tax=Solibacillus kalamii TaxID=1748298 RepID=UPI001EF91034|nr:GGDEF domain-containing protein [Solibacillus kalamii]MBM7666053.1 diguanylate cyclase (GGDEF)-like protein [Solibacillus kalamii]
MAVGIVLLFNVIRYFYYHQYLALPFNWTFFILTAIFVSIAWWAGKQFDKVKYLSERDPLTGTYNRRMVEQYFYRAVKICDIKKQSLGVIMLDLNKFKEINDEYGHHKGDELLVQVAAALNKFIGKHDLVARWGGDEFIVLVDNMKENSADDYVKELQRAITLQNAESFSNVEASVGYAIYPQHGKTFQKLIQEADAYMYKDKKDR